MAKSSIITHEYNAETRSLDFTVADGGEFSFDLTPHMPEGLSALGTALIVHGATQKISDGAAVAKKLLTGNAKKDGKLRFDRMVAIRDRLANGDWRKPAEGGSSVSGIIEKAYAEFIRDGFAARGQPVPSDEAIHENYEKKSRGEKLALKSVREIATIMDRLRSESPAAAKVDTDALFAELGGK